MDMGMSEVCVPASALAVADEKDQPQAPVVGDKGTAQVDFTVNRVEGDQAYIRVDAVNGQAVAGAGSMEQGADPMAALEDQARAMPAY